MPFIKEDPEDRNGQTAAWQIVNRKMEREGGRSLSFLDRKAAGLDLRSCEEQIVDESHKPIARAITAHEGFNDGFSDGMDLELSARALQGQIDAVKAGDMSGPEATLLIQSNTLDLLFNSLLVKAARQDDPKHFQSLLQLAFKAQTQCRVTLETLSEVKNPRGVMFIRQQNNGQNVQVNNETQAHGQGIENNGKRQNELLEGDSLERMDTGSTGEASREDPQLEALAEVHRTTEPRRKSPSIKKQR